MQTLAIDAIPNQKFSTTLDGIFYDITIKETNGCMSCDVSRNNEVIVRGQRIIANSSIIPYRYLENKLGNFFMVCQNEEIPYYDLFGISQFLMFASNEEIERIRGGI